MIDTILGLNFAKELLVILVAAMPIFELRLAIPEAIAYLGFPWYYAFILAVIGNMLPIPFILLFLNKITVILNRIPFFKKWLDWLFERTRHRGTQIQKYKGLGLILFVAVPLPITGAWTGALAAVLFGIGFKQAFFSIFLGVIIAGIIVTCLTLLGWLGAIIAGVAICSILIYGFLKSRRNKKNDCSSA